MNLIHRTTLALLLALATAGPSRAQVPQIINYQGKISVGTTPYTGTGRFRFALVNGDGTQTYWSHDDTSNAGSAPVTAVALPVVGGLYIAPLGDTAVTGMRPVPPSVFTNGDVRLRVWFDDGTNGVQMLAPDQRITSVGYAMVAGAVTDGSVGTAQLAPNLVLGGTTSGSFSGTLSGNATSATTAGSSASFTGPLSGDVTGGQQTTTVVSISGMDAAAVAGGAALANMATAENTAGALVKRDAGGNFTAGTITAGAFVGDGSGLTGLPGGGISWATVTGTTQQAQANKGYIVSGDAQVTITLPASPAVGDVVRVCGAGAGGWKIASNAGQGIYFPPSSDFVVTPRGNYGSWSAVACSADGTKLVACDYYGQIHTSTDAGVSWTARESTRNWCSVASSADGSKLVAAVEYGRLYTSTDSGVSWTPRESDRAWRKVASSADGTKLVAVAYDARIYTSTDSGVSWTPRESERSWRSVASSADGTKLFAVVYPGYTYTSTDSGVSWTTNWWLGQNRPIVDVASSADGMKLVVCLYNANSEGVWISTDAGINWTGPVLAAGPWRAVASSADGEKLVVVGDHGQMYTTDGGNSTWTQRPTSPYWDWACVASSADGRNLIAGQYSGRLHTVQTGVAGKGTSALSGPGGNSIELLHIGDGVFQLLSSSGIIRSY